MSIRDLILHSDFEADDVVELLADDEILCELTPHAIERLEEIVEYLQAA